MQEKKLDLATEKYLRDLHLNGFQHIGNKKKLVLTTGCFCIKSNYAKLTMKNNLKIDQNL